MKNGMKISIIFLSPVKGSLPVGYIEFGHACSCFGTKEGLLWLEEGCVKGLRKRQQMMTFMMKHVHRVELFLHRSLNPKRLRDESICVIWVPHRGK